MSQEPSIKLLISFFGGFYVLRGNDMGVRAGWTIEDAFEKEVDRSKRSNARKHNNRVYTHKQAEAIH